MGATKLALYQVAIKPVAQASRLCRRRLNPAATKNISLIATGYQLVSSCQKNIFPVLPSSGP